MLELTAQEKDAIREKVGDRMVIASVSGGKDSTAMCLHLRDLGIPYEAVFMDTGWETEGTYHFIDEVLPKYIGPVKHIGYNHTFDDEREAIAKEFEERMGHPSPMIRLVLRKGMFPSRVRRFCTEQLKVYPMRDYLKTRNDEPINTVGVRAQESVARSQLSEWEWNDTFDCDVWRPLIRWSEADVIDIHKRHGVPPNPLYLKGAARVGCWPCIFARKKEIRQISEMTPERVELLADLEKAVEVLAKKRYAAKGETFESLGYHAPTWFQNPTSSPDPVTGKRAGDTWPIHKVVEWSRTKRGGKSEEPFAPLPHEAGCFRWGMCDTSWRQDKVEELPDVFEMFEDVSPEEQKWRDEMESYMGGEAERCED